MLGILLAKAICLRVYKPFKRLIVEGLQKLINDQPPCHFCRLDRDSLERRHMRKIWKHHAQIA